MKAPTRGTARRWGFRGLLLLSLVGAVLAYAGPLVFELRGQTLLVLTSGSMDPKYPAGSAVVAEPVTPDQLRVGQVITFKETVEGSKYVTHRIVGLKTLPKTDLDGTPLLDDKGAEIPAYYVQTQGDGNLTPDPNLTPVQQVRFLVVDGYPGLGSWLLWSRTLTGKLLLFAPPFLLLLLAEVWSWRPGRKAAGRQDEGRLTPSQRHDDVAASLA
ncbi:MAG: signal peptidase I [Actinomycetota bacterium]|nr:signal peptidase I [Actinomycetota bacterium]MDH5278181.1 signal peptidase I [Actinomycetota bacterium]